MYCINCGVKLADSEKKCPLCQTLVYHPDLPPQDGAPLYPADRCPKRARRNHFPHVLATAVCLLALAVVLMADLHTSGRVTWSGYVIGALALTYVSVVLPMWFRRPNPVIFTPCGVAAALGYLLYIDLVTPGRWFLPFAFPVAGSLGLILITVVTLTHYLKRGKLYVFGGALIAVGLVCLLTEFLINMTFHFQTFLGWSLYPLVTLTLLGGLLIFLGACSGARNTMERKFFL